MFRFRCDSQLVNGNLNLWEYNSRPTMLHRNCHVLVQTMEWGISVPNPKASAPNPLGASVREPHRPFRIGAVQTP